MGRRIPRPARLRTPYSSSASAKTQCKHPPPPAVSTIPPWPPSPRGESPTRGSTSLTSQRFRRFSGSCCSLHNDCLSQERIIALPRSCLRSLSTNTARMPSLVETPPIKKQDRLTSGKQIKRVAGLPCELVTPVHGKPRRSPRAAAGVW